MPEIAMPTSHIFGANYKNIQLVPHQPYWSVLYAQEAGLIANLLADELIQIDHIGSTSIPHIKAKPVIDILIQTESGIATEKICTLFEENGYSIKSFPEHVEKLFYKEKSNLRLFNVHLTKYGSDFSKDRINFRNRLRLDLNLAKEYELIKTESARNNSNDSNNYYQGKKEFFMNTLGLGH